MLTLPEFSLKQKQRQIRSLHKKLTTKIRQIITYVKTKKLEIALLTS